MNKILKKIDFSHLVTGFIVDAPQIAKSCRAGHFVIVRTGEKGERIPLTIADSDKTAGTITLIIQRIGDSTNKLCDLNEGDFVAPF